MDVLFLFIDREKRLENYKNGKIYLRKTITTEAVLIRVAFSLFKINLANEN